MSLPGLANDPRHNWLHVIWGVALFGLVGLHLADWAAVLFGVFYTTLAVLGVVVLNPFGLLLGPGENAFHFIVGPLALLLGLVAVRSSSASSGWTSTGVSGDASGATAR